MKDQPTEPAVVRCGALLCDPEGAAPGSANEPLTNRESAQLEAALVLLRRGELPLAVRVLNAERPAELAKDLQAYIAAHSPSDPRSAAADKEK